MKRGSKRNPLPAEAADVSQVVTSELPEPRVGRQFYTPIWLVALFGLMLYWAALYMDHNGGGFHPLVFNQGDLLVDVDARVPKSEAGALIAQGKRVYNLYCSACHQPNGRGMAGQFPTLVDSEWVLDEGPNRIIRIVLNGLQGPITVQGRQYNNVMLPWRDQLADEEIAAVVTFIRMNEDWNHAASPANADQVKVIRETTADRSKSWTASELQSIPPAD